jgi:hypothetical protein
MLLVAARPRARASGDDAGGRAAGAWWVVLGCYVLAKLFEIADQPCSPRSAP